MPPSKHAILGASSAHRWLRCTPSAMWEAQMQPQESSAAAQEGTLAHAIAEAHLRQWLAGKPIKTPKKMMDDPMYDHGMEEHIATYTDYVLRILAETPNGLLQLETRVDYHHIVPDGFGTCDALIIGSDNTLHVLDLKYGKGVPVEAANNPQLRLYAIGAVVELLALYRVDRVVTHIIQPRLDSITTETLTWDELAAWGAEYVAPRAKLAAEGKGEHVPGDHCRWCRCKTICRAYAERQLDMAKLRFDDLGEEKKPPELSAEEIADVLRRVDDLVSWGKLVKEYALDQAVNHQAAFPGWKVVEGRANRIITDEPAAIDRLTAENYGMEDITELRGITALEKLVGAKRLGQLLDGLIIKPAGKPVLAPETDKRPALTGAKINFTPMEDGEE